MYERTIPLYTFSKSYAMTGVRLGYVAIKDPAMRDRAKKILFYTASNVASIVQYGGIGALEGLAGLHRGRSGRSCRRGATCSTAACARSRGDVFSGKPPAGAFYAFVQIDPGVERPRSRGVDRDRVAVVGDGRVPDQARAHRLRAGRGLRRRTAKATCASASRAIGEELTGALSR